jgi:hypothetical protein
VRPDPTIVGWAITVATPAAIDVVLIRRGHTTLSSGLGHFLRPEPPSEPKRWRWTVVAGWVLLTIHLFSVLFPPRARSVMSKVDPLGASARLVPPRLPVR